MTEPRFRVLHAFRAPVGGLFRHVVDAARAQIERGHEVGIFCDSTTGGERAERVFAELRPHLTLGITRVPMRRNPHPSDLAVLASLAKLDRRLRPDILHGHGSKGGVYARLAAGRGKGAPARAYTPHGGSFNYKPGSVLHTIYMKAEALLARRTDLFLFESAFVKGRFDANVGATDALVRVVQNGIGEPEFEPLARHASPHDLVYVGELRQAKGVETLIDALALLRAGGQRLTLMMVGSGPSEHELQQRARDQGVFDAITFVPPQPIRAALAQARIMVIPSRAESLPYVILEAAAARQPLVATHVGGIPEIFGPYAGELICPDDPGILAGAITKKLAETEEERAAKAEALSEFVRFRFSLAKMVDGILDGYKAALDGRAVANRAQSPGTVKVSEKPSC